MKSKIVTMRILLPEGLGENEFYDGMNDLIRESCSGLIFDWAYGDVQDYEMAGEYEEGSFFS